MRAIHANGRRPSLLRLTTPALAVGTLLALSAAGASAQCSIQFTSPARGSTVSSAQVSVSGTADGFAQTFAQGTASATANGVTFFSYSGVFTSTINFGGGSAAVATLQPGANRLVVTGSVSGCSDSDSMIIYYVPPPPVEQKNAGRPKDENCSNPVNGATGNKYQEEVDYTAAAGVPLEFRRHYNASFVQPRALGRGWRHSYDRQFAASGTAVGSTVSIIRPDGVAYRFTKAAAGWVSDTDINDRLTDALVGGQTQWQLVIGENNSTEVYDANGRLVSMVAVSARRVNLSYDENGRLQFITDALSARRLSLAYTGDSAQVSTLTDPAGQVYTYQYADGQRLSRVMYPGVGAPARQYLYNESAQTGGANLPDALTGIIDENGDRYATFGYNATGRGTFTEHAGGVQRYAMAYNADGSTTVTDPLGAARTYTYTLVQGVRRQVGQSQPAGAGCAASASATTFDANGNIATQTDFNGNITTHAWDLARNLKTQRVEASGTPEARSFNFEWHPNWRLPLRVAEPKKRITYQYNGDLVSGSPLSCAPAAANVPLGASTRPAPLLCRELHEATTSARGAEGFSATATGLPRTWAYSYNSAGQLLSVDGPRTDVSDVTTTTYHSVSNADHAVGDPQTIVNALGHTTRMDRFDGNGRPLAMRDANDVAMTSGWHPRGWLMASSIAALNTTYDRDAVGQLLSVTRPDASKMSYDYDAAQRLISTSDLTGRTTNIARDNLGNITQTTWSNPGGGVARRAVSSFDVLGREQSSTDTRNGTNFVTQYGYDANGNPRLTTDPKSQSTSTQFDALDRAREVTDAIAGLTRLAYDARDQLTELRAPNNATTAFTIDGLSNLSREVSPNRGTLNATHDAAGNLLTLTDARNITQTRSYDALNRLSAVSYPAGGENITYTWDSAVGCTFGIGRLCAVSDNGGSTTYAYDARGNRLRQTRTEAGFTYTTSYGHDTADRIASIVAPTSQVLVMGRDTDGVVQQITTNAEGNPQLKLVDGVQTDAAGNTTAQAFGNGVTQTRSYTEDARPSQQTQVVPAGADAPPGPGPGVGNGDTDAPTLPEWGAILMGIALLGAARRRQQKQRTRKAASSDPSSHSPSTTLRSLLALASTAVLSLCLWAPSAPALANEALSYDANGNVLTRSLPGGTTTYGYDPLDRIRSEAGPAKTQTLVYDANDNRLSDAEGPKTYSPNTDRITTLNGQSVTLDASGNTLQARGYTYTWNQAGQLKTVSRAGALLATYFYDLHGQRSRKQTTAAAPQGAATVVYHYDDAGQLLAETTAAGAPLVTYAWRDATPVSLIVHTGSGVTAAARVLYLEVDHLGSPIAARNQAGRLLWKWESDALGSTAPNEDPDADGQKTTINLRFPGQYFDAESALHYNWNRYYDPKLGRYISSDPIGVAGGSNTYGYGYQNSLKNTDPRGLAVPVAVAACMANPACAAAAAIATAATAKACIDTYRGVRNWMRSEGSDAPVDIVVPGDKYPEAAGHIRDAQGNGQPDVLTIDRGGSKGHRREAMRGNPVAPGQDRDEYPPALTSEGGKGASVRPISPSDNRGAGACIGAQCSGLPDGTRIRIIPGI
jgi:RHS repeat-associated protein